MLIELITPLLIASAPVSVDVVDPSYNHSTQVSASVEEIKTMSTSTINGTQTFDWQGVPRDADNDSDADPF